MNERNASSMHHHKRLCTNVVYELELSQDTCFQKIGSLRMRRHLKGHLVYPAPWCAGLLCRAELFPGSEWIFRYCNITFIVIKWLSMVNFQPDCLGSSSLLFIIFVALDKFFSFSVFTYETGMIIQTHSLLFVILKYRVSERQKIW